MTQVVLVWTWSRVRRSCFFATQSFSFATQSLCISNSSSVEIDLMHRIISQSPHAATLILIFSLTFVLTRPAMTYNTCEWRLVGKFFHKLNLIMAALRSASLLESALTKGNNRMSTWHMI